MMQEARQNESRALKPIGMAHAGRASCCHGSCFLPKNHLRKIFSIIYVALTFTLSGQDVHFSQFYESPVLLNPATAGSTLSDFRAAVNYRNQWQNVISPFQTIGLAFDSKFHHLGKSGFNHLGYGITMYTDKAGQSKSSTNQINAALSYHLYIDRQNIISFGVNAGIFQKIVNTSGLKWDAQFNGKTYDPSLATNENSNYQSIAKFDLGAGFLYRHQESNTGISYEAGFSMMHLTKPSVSYYQNSDAIGFKYTAIANVKLKLDHGLFLLPSALYAMQNKQSEITAGGNLRFVPVDQHATNDMGLEKAQTTAFQFGMFYRYRDAVIFTAMIEYNHHINLGLSYDVNVSKLNNASRYRGGYEICLVFTERKHSKLRTKL
jgi:type IX secretion system PorP/SprF family membrane protein